MDTGMSNLEEGLKLTTEAATDKREIQDILERLFATIDQLEAATHATGTRVEEIAGAAQAVKQSVDETGRSTDMAFPFSARARNFSTRPPITGSPSLSAASPGTIRIWPWNGLWARWPQSSPPKTPRGCLSVMPVGNW